uniref:uncharacterized protein n=1 Tax=Myxine glutinosa TaxID=7769 RepID=UPI00358E1635
MHSWNHSVFGVLSNNTVVRLCKTTWFPFPGSAMSIVKSGPSGVWGIDTRNNLYTFDGQKWWFMKSDVKDCETTVENTIFWIDRKSKVNCAKRNEQKPFDLSPSHVYDHEIKTMTCSARKCFVVKKDFNQFVRFKRTCPLIEISQKEKDVPIDRLMAMPNGKIFGLDEDGYLQVRNVNRPAVASWVKKSTIQNIRLASIGDNVLWILHNGTVKACNASLLLT